MSAAKAHAPRWLALGVFAGLPLVLAALLVANVLRIAELRGLVDRAQLQLARFDARAGRAGGAAATPQDYAGLYVVGGARPLAAANLQQRLVDLLGSASGRLIETQTLNMLAEEDADDAVRLRASFDIDNAGLLQFLHSLETGLPLLNVVSLAVRSLPAAGSQEGATQILRVDLVVEGYWRTGS